MILYAIDYFLCRIFGTSCVVCRQNTTHICRTCIASLLVSPVPYCLWNYRDKNVKKLIVSIKTRPRYILCNMSGSLLAQKIFSFIRYNQTTHTLVLVPIPARTKRMRLYGFNQCYLIAQGFKQIFPSARIETLVRIRTTRKQALVTNKTERQGEMHKAFLYKPTKSIAFHKKPFFVIIDDVTTTGATLSEGARAIMEHYNDVDTTAIYHGLHSGVIDRGRYTIVFSALAH